ncbi:hypothetical protein J2Y69_001021 [Microbacterium resistens]|uniref:Uncharacterized protein n=1 Tax=Microbacterium resistens TaxID=156977 RepID=A0ABU1S9Z0_9MICO|nr:hypothetical protein [Microbacterium resistens]MDR6866429.1 hypothetical protein [Microbacterium resistens]
MASADGAWSRGSLLFFVVAAVLGVLVMAGAWTWFVFTYATELGEQRRALSFGGEAAGGFVGGLSLAPLVIAHVVGFVVLGIAATHDGRETAKRFRVTAGTVLACSVLGLLVAQIVSGGRLLLVAMGFVG